ncbi:MAG: hypothetical protein LBF81_05320 [Prevotellaceae bacterium]|jgi:hypothetical protein|nr:hypothetical protein [Prevotellaceae bacterium]
MKITQHRKNLTKLQASLLDMAKDSISNGASFSQTADRLKDAITLYKSQHPKYKGQTYVSYSAPNRYEKYGVTTKEAIYIRDAGGDYTLISILNK